MNEDDAIIIKQNLITILVPCLLFIPAIFTLFIILLGIVTNSLPIFAYWVAFMIFVFLFLPGLITINKLMRFGNKKLVINSQGITWCNWKVQTLLWQEISDITFKNFLQQDYLVMIPVHGEKIELNFNDIQLNQSNEEVYHMILEKWYAAGS